MRALRRDRNAYWKAIAEETERAAACGATRKLYQILKSGPKWVKFYLNEMKAASHIKPESYVDGMSFSRSFSITQHPRTLHFYHRIHPRRKIILVKLTRPLWRKYALPSDKYAITESLERMAQDQRIFTRRASTPWAHGCIG